MKKEVVVIGLGYVGLPSVVNHVKNGHQVTGFDIDQRKIDLLNQGVSDIDTVSDKTIMTLKEKGVIFTADEKMIKNKDVYIIDVPTPIDSNKIPDLSYVEAAVKLIIDKVKIGSLIVLESTTYPGTTEEYLVEKFSSLGYKIGTDLFIAYSPERIDPGNTQSLKAKIPRIVAGFSEGCLIQAQAFFGSHVTAVTDLKTAELAKIYENTFRLVNIALADELQKISDDLRIDVGEVLAAAATKPFGFMKFTPNLGIGGHCIPVDPYYLTWLMETRGIKTPLIDTAGKINDSMLDYYLQQINDYVTGNKQTMTSMTIAVLGVTYKKNVADIRMSSVMTLIEKLKTMGAHVVAFDDVLHNYHHKSQEEIRSLAGKYQQLKTFDLVIYAVDHDSYENKKPMIIENSQLFYDLTTA
ncbi:nucleotide sugar dehydrogenase [Enterococcus termitis]|uniref:Nucleotide sugar dehydrogenase n=1 Tax=Enterococcus termitis TaxID=332950 RepID=A0A1E5GQC1_9ENTE|nr:nucleotide sugar dehydrogenase [Enterococcus termitis]OEG14897.1 nucleotide sugar dehydrogenase [Enterococcus termitis]OJG96414.1 nucleotide sugar dehydrogenase [Enterococcus termitis]